MGEGQGNAFSLANRYAEKSNTASGEKKIELLKKASDLYFDAASRHEGKTAKGALSLAFASLGYADLYQAKRRKKDIEALMHYKSAEKNLEKAKDKITEIKWGKLSSIFLGTNDIRKEIDSLRPILNDNLKDIRSEIERLRKNVDKSKQETRIY